MTNQQTIYLIIYIFIEEFYSNYRVSLSDCVEESIPQSSIQTLDYRIDSFHTSLVHPFDYSLSFKSYALSIPGVLNLSVQFPLLIEEVITFPPSTLFFHKIF